MISLTYGREPGQARVAQRFGPIAGSQGHRRLNVLFTRARRRVVVFSSMGSNDVLASAGSRRGVRVLRDYLRYVESRRLEAGEATGRGADSDFEREVRSRLEAHGFSVDPQVGVAAYRIDLGVRHPSQPSVYLAGIECDGAAFHSAQERAGPRPAARSGPAGTGLEHPAGVVDRLVFQSGGPDRKARRRSLPLGGKACRRGPAVDAGGAARAEAAAADNARAGRAGGRGRRADVGVSTRRASQTLSRARSAELIRGPSFRRPRPLRTNRPPRLSAGPDD